MEIYEADLPILTAFMFHRGTDDQAEGFRYAFRIMSDLTDRIKELEQRGDYVDNKKENWRQAQLRKNLPFYG